ncbi:DUF2306 domain-containing protein [Cohaesibacter gelatinilyticus]|uniref:Uncharacterized membrane protein n=1 Tax=Cohaesibacter gelatinilyticus TaxID=372072 RepID=A0A285PGI4_9HYPH|nr:DUF2306 domain-containing protein [Cohaesibacter gelatinilyticus]SNZ20822.1 Uncharacterized membrane protein [Cohaesibacter gelatinilyticus]
MVGLHLYSALGALLLGGLLFWIPKGTFAHRLMGRIWMMLMLVTALSAFGLSSGMMLGMYFSPLHGLAIYTLFMLWNAYRYVRAGHIGAHRKAVLGLYWGALVIPGTIAVLWPGRFLNQLVMGWIELM